MTTYALCIGIDEYEKPLYRLRCARKDADDLARVLREALGFEAQSLKPSASRDKLATEDVFDALDAIGAQLRAGDSFVLSFSGHGAVVGDEQVFYLSGARPHLVRAGKVAGPGVLPWSDLREHTAQEQWSGVQRIFILDACREPLLPSKRLEEPAAARFDGRVLLARNLVPGRKQDRLQARKPDEPPHTVLHACSDRQLAFELPDGHNSVFTAALMQTLKQRAGKPWQIDKDYLHELRECMEKVRAQAGLDEDKFVQAPAWNDVPAQVAPPVATVGSGNAGATAAATGTGVDVRELDTRLWRLSCAKNTVAGYEDYIRHAPPGAEHVDEAADRIEELLAREQDAASWQQAQAEQPEGLQARAQHFRGVLPRLRSKQARAECEKVVAALEKQIAAARPQPGQVLKDSELSPELVVLPRGRFTMGSPTSEPERDRDEGPQPVIRIDYDLAVGRYPVTQREWTAVMVSNPSYFKGCDDCPVENVSWNDAQEYLVKLNQRTGGKFGYRLLSEAEWEYMARGVTRADAPSTAFWWGNAIDPSLANYDGYYRYNGGARGPQRCMTTPVGSFKVNPFGVYDVHGNVYEWVQDVYDAYRGATGDGSARTVSADPSDRVARGGSYSSEARCLRSAYRYRDAPVVHGPGLGLRIARTLP